MKYILKEKYDVYDYVCNDGIIVDIFVDRCDFHTFSDYFWEEDLSGALFIDADPIIHNNQTHLIRETAKFSFDGCSDRVKALLADLIFKEPVYAQFIIGSDK